VITVLTEWYIDSSPARQAEYAEALRRNYENPYVTEIWLCGSPAALAIAPEHPKVVRFAVEARMTFGALFDIAADKLPGKVVSIMNADCYFDETAALVDDIDLSRRVLCLTRWDVLPTGELRFFDAFFAGADAWIFRSPVHVLAPFFLGIQACDKKLAWLLKHEAGLKVANPSLSLRICHLHVSQKRNYDPLNRLTWAAPLHPADAAGGATT
jgi:hypothetical protein